MGHAAFPMGRRRSGAGRRISQQSDLRGRKTGAAVPASRGARTACSMNLERRCTTLARTGFRRGLVDKRPRDALRPAAGLLSGDRRCESRRAAQLAGPSWRGSYAGGAECKAFPVTLPNRGISFRIERAPMPARNTIPPGPRPKRNGPGGGGSFRLSDPLLGGRLSLRRRRADDLPQRGKAA